MADAASPSLRPACDPATELDARFRAAIRAATGADADPAIRASGNPKFGDYQVNAAMALAKELGKNPREVADAVLKAADLAGVATKCEVAGPGFINVTLERAFVENRLATLAASDSFGIPAPTDPHAVVIDLCGVNVAKQMHVGHLRATIIGDSLARVFERLGRKVWRENHLGDWGLPIAMTLAKLVRERRDFARLTLDDLNAAYRGAQKETATDDLDAAYEFRCGPHRIAELELQYEPARAAMEDAKKTLIRLQSGDAEIVRLWERLIEVTMEQVYEAARTLNAKLGRENNRGESFFATGSRAWSMRSGRRASRRATRERWWCRSQTASARSSSRSRTADSSTPPPISRPCASAPTNSMATSSSTSSTRGSATTSAMSSMQRA